MKKLVGKDIGSYAFDASAQTITFSGCGTLTLENLLLITNVTDHIIIYNFADASLSGTLVGDVLTLTYNTTSMSDGDALQIYIDVPSGSAIVQEKYDEITMTYTNGDLTGLVYKLDGTTVASVSLGYTNGDLVSIQRV